jgi:hypothetical protein
MKTISLALALASALFTFAPRAHAQDVSSAETGARAAEPIAAQATLVTGSSAPGNRPAGPGQGVAGVGVRFGFGSMSLDAARLPMKSGLADSLNQQGVIVTPSVQLGGDGYFFKLDFPLAKMETFSAYGLGIYPLNYGHYFRKTGLMPYGSAGIVGSALTMPGQGLSGAFGQVRVAAGLTYRVVRELNVLLEVGYSPWAAGVVVDKRKTAELEQSANDGQSVDLMPGNRSAQGGMGNALDFALGVEWL